MKLIRIRRRRRRAKERKREKSREKIIVGYAVQRCEKYCVFGIGLV